MAGIQPNNVTLNARGDILVGGTPTTINVNPRGKSLGLGPSGYVLSSNGQDAVWVPYATTNGSVSSIDITAGAGLTSTGGPITSSGSITVGLAYNSLAAAGGNVTGSIDLVGGTFTLVSAASGGTVTSVGVSSSDFSIGGTNPITTSGTIALNLTNTGVTAGTYAFPTITVDAKGRVTAASVGSVNLATQATGNLPVANLGSGTNANNTTYWRGDGSWVSPFSNTTPLALGTASAGTANGAARADHVHAMPTASDVGALPISGGTVTSNLTVTGNLTVNGGTTTINSAVLSVADSSLSIGVVGSPTDTTANGGGLFLSGSTTKSLSWANDTNNNWTSSENFNIVTGRTYKINNATVLSSTALGNSVVSSSLASVGTITSGTWNGSTMGIAYGGTGQTNANAALNALLPTQTGNNGKILQTDGSNTSWVTVSGSGTVTSVAVSGGTTGLSTSGGPITAAGTITLAGVLVGANGGTGVNNGSSTITLAGNLVTAGGFSTTLTTTGSTNVTLPTTGTLATIAGTETLTNKTVNGLVHTGGTVNKVRVVTAAGAVTVTATDFYVEINKTSGAATTVNLPASPVTGQTFIIKDGKGDAATNNITVTPAAGNIDGVATFVMNVNYQSIILIYNGTSWSIN